MAYEREAFVETTQANAPSVMREERAIDPYAHKARMERALTSVRQENTSGAVRAEETPKPAETVTLAPQVAALARKEQAFRKREQELKTQKSQLEAQSTEVAQFKAMREKLQAKDYSALDDVVDYNEYSQYQVNKLNGTDPNQEAIKKLSDEISQLKQQQEESTSKLFDAAVAERRNAVNQLVETSPEFTGIKKLGLQEHVVQHILSTWEEDSEELTVDQAVKDVKEEILRRKKRLDDAFAEPAPQVDMKKQMPPLKSGLKTLTNNVTAGDPNKPAKSFRGMSDSERWAEARRRAEAKLQARQG